MNFSDRELALLMVALDNTGHDLRQTATATGDSDIRSQADGMQKMWDRIHSEYAARKDERENPSRWSGLTVYK